MKNSGQEKKNQRKILSVKLEEVTVTILKAP